MARRRNVCCFLSRWTLRRPSSMRSRRIASCWRASGTRSSRSPAEASWCTRRPIRIPGSKRRAACRSWSPISLAAGLAAGRIDSSGLPPRTPAAPRSRRARHSRPTRCASSSSGCFLPHSPRTTCMAGPRWSSCQRKSWNGVLAAPDTRHLTPVIVGPTGVGKTAVAVALASLTPITVISADARQVYRGLDIGTAKPARATPARAIEVALLTGHALSWWQREARESGMLRPWYIHLTVPREVLHRRLAARVDEMLRAGLVQEVQRQLAAGVAPDAPGLDGIGYREVVAMLEGDLPESALSQAILVSTRRYAKRQETWFRNQLRGDEGRGKGDGVWMLDATESPDMLAAKILGRWHTLPPSLVPRPGL